MERIGAAMAVAAAAVWALLLSVGDADVDVGPWVRDARWAAIVLAMCALAGTATSRTRFVAALLLSGGWWLADATGAGVAVAFAALVAVVAAVAWIRPGPPPSGRRGPLVFAMVASYASPALILSALSGADGSPAPAILVVATIVLPPGLAVTALLCGRSRTSTAATADAAAPVGRPKRGAAPAGRSKRMLVVAGAAIVGLAVTAAAAMATSSAAVGVFLGGVVAFVALGRIVAGRKRRRPVERAGRAVRLGAGIAFGGLLAVIGALLTFALAAVATPVPAAVGVGLLAAGLLWRLADHTAAEASPGAGRASRAEVA
jgi:hypothetical protein